MDEAPGKNGDYEGYDEEDFDGGLMSFWRQTARKLGSIQKKKKEVCKMP